MDMADQVVGKLSNTGVERAPGVARASGRVGVVRQRHQSLQFGAMVHVLGTHHADGLADEGVATRLEHGKQNRFFLVHVREQFGLHGFEQVAQTGWNMGVLAVHGFDAPRHANQLGQLLAMHVMKARDDVIHQLRRCGRFGRSGWLLQGREFRQHRIKRQALVGHSLCQRHVSTTAEVKFEPAKHGSGARKLHGDAANACIGRNGGCGFKGVNSCIHGVSP